MLTRLLAVTFLLLVAAAPTLHSRVPRTVVPLSYKWPEEFEDRRLMAIGLREDEKAYFNRFPGAVQRFTDGERELLMRRVERPTRKLHPARDCLQGTGFEIVPAPLRLDAEKRLWSCVNAQRPGQSMRVCELIVSADGQHFSDVSTWFWSAALGRSQGPWMAITSAKITY